ncbi:MAG: TIGR03619 family F420-dependent LLM class oxidoreductase [Chloroflexi bacterium]|nr:TIGR03619 family F420-dependent LLM class oxidoreductase [Chloroflexota bacterium]
MSVKIGLSGASVMAREGRETFLRYIDAAEELDWDSIWFSDRIVGPAWRMDPIAGMAIVTGRSEKLKFGTGVLLMSMRSPVTAARELATIDLLSNGRLVLGVGVGQESPAEYEAMGVRKRDRGKRLDEAIHIMRRLWTEERVTYESEFIKLTDATIGVRPKQANLPIWMGSRSEAGLRRTGRLGDGWLPTQITPEEVAAGIARIQEYAAEVGREVEHDHFGLQINSYLVESGTVPEHIKERYLLRRRSDVSPEQLNLLGTPDQIMARLREYIDAGASKFVFNPACGADEMLEQMRLQAEAIVQPFHKKLVPLGA